MTIYNFKKVKGKRKIAWNRGRRRGIEEASDRIGNYIEDIRDLITKKSKIKILEVGAGYGKSLLELKTIFGDKIETHGINREPRWNLDLIKRFGLYHKIFSKNEIKDNLPKLYILDAGKKLPFKAESFDFVYSVSSIQYIHDKALFLEEINRILKKEGIARLHDAFKKKENYPVELKNLFDIWKNGKRIEVKDYVLNVKKCKNIQFKKTKKNPMGYLLMKKDKNFKMGLQYITSFDLHQLGEDLWGTKVIYKIK